MSVITYQFHSSVLNCATNMVITLPEITRGPLRGRDLDTIYQPDRLFPTLYLCHGGPRDSSAWLRYSQAELICDAKNMMTVSVDAMESFFCDMKHGRKYFTYLTEEVPRVAQTLFHSSPRREDNFIMGMSMGAHGAMKAALRCPEKYAAVMAISGAKDQVKMRKLAEERGIKASYDAIDDAFGPAEELPGSENDLMYLAEALAKSGKEAPMLYTACGTEDYGLALCREFHEHLDRCGLKNEFITMPGKHDYFFANRVLEYTVNNLFQIREDVL